VTYINTLVPVDMLAAVTMTYLLI